MLESGLYGLINTLVANPVLTLIEVEMLSFFIISEISDSMSINLQLQYAEMLYKCFDEWFEFHE